MKEIKYKPMRQHSDIAKEPLYDIFFNNEENERPGHRCRKILWNRSKIYSFRQMEICRKQYCLSGHVGNENK